MQNPAYEDLTESDPLQSPVRFTAGSSFPSGKPKSFLDQIAIINPTNNFPSLRGAKQHANLQLSWLERTKSEGSRTLLRGHRRNSRSS